MSIEKKWKEIGVVVGTTSTDTYEFVISDLSASVGDIVITKSSTPLTKNVLVWGRIVWMERTNPTFPSEFAAELARENLDMNETIGMSGAEHLRSEVQIMGCTDASKSESDDIILEPLNYPHTRCAYIYVNTHPGCIIYVSKPQKLCRKAWPTRHSVSGQISA